MYAVVCILSVYCCIHLKCILLYTCIVFSIFSHFSFPHLTFSIFIVVFIIILTQASSCFFRHRLSAEDAKPESNNRWKSELGHVCMWVCGYVWYLELSRKPRHVAQQTRYQNVGLRNGHCLGTVSSGCDFQPARGARNCQNK